MFYFQRRWILVRFAENYRYFHLLSSALQKPTTTSTAASTSLFAFCVFSSWPIYYYHFIFYFFFAASKLCDTWFSLIDSIYERLVFFQKVEFDANYMIWFLLKKSLIIFEEIWCLPNSDQPIRTIILFLIKKSDAEGNIFFANWFIRF